MAERSRAGQAFRVWDHVGTVWALVMGCARQGTPLTVRAEGSDLVFQPAVLRVAAGSMVVLTFENNAVFSHYFILVNSDEATLRAADMTGMYAHSPLLPSQTIQDFSFTVPSAGTYFYFCSFPGHLAGGKRGVLTVQ